MIPDGERDHRAAAARTDAWSGGCSLRGPVTDADGLRCAVCQQRPAGREAGGALFNRTLVEVSSALSHSSGAELVMSIRPQRIRVANEGEPADNPVRGVVTATEFQGGMNIREALGDTALVALLRIRPTEAAESYTRPSSLFGSADFDTKHERDPARAPSHGTIRVSHFFFAFGYAISTAKQKAPKTSATICGASGAA